MRQQARVERYSLQGSKKNMEEKQKEVEQFFEENMSSVEEESTEKNTEDNSTSTEDQEKYIENQEEEQNEVVENKEIEVLGKKYSSLEDLAEDYKRLYQEFQRRNQEKFQQQPQASEINEEDLNFVKKTLKEKFGIVFDDDVKNLQEKIQIYDVFFQELYNNFVQARDQQVIEDLAKKYDGSSGEPKFSIEEIRNKLKDNPDLAVWVKVGDDFLVDLEQTYKKIHDSYWGAKIPKKPNIVKTETGLRKSQEESYQEPKTREEKVKFIEDFFSRNLQS